MSVTIFFDGLNQIGLSFAMALEKEKKTFLRVAFDFDMGVMRDAKKAGFIDQSAMNGLTAAANADVIVIDQPLDFLEEHYKILGEVIRQDTVILDTSMIPLKSGEWAKQYIHRHSALVSFTPGLNSKYFYDHAFNSQAAHADLFVNSSIAIASMSNEHVDGEAMAASLAKILGATPMFMDVLEVQVAMVKTRILPRLMAAALVNTVMDLPGWEEARMLGSADFAKTSFPVMGIFEDKQPGMEAKAAEDITVRVLDQYIDALQDLRSLITAKKSVDLQQAIQNASESRALWESTREHNQFPGDQETAMPKMGDTFQQMFLGGFGKRRKDED